MEKYVTGKFTCGHTGDIYINGWNAKELREYATERFHTEVCPRCKKNEKYEAAVRHAQALKLPDLVNDDEETRVNGTIIREKLIATFIHEAKPFYRKVREAYSYNGDALAATCWPFCYATLSRYFNLGMTLPEIEAVFLEVLHRYVDAGYWIKMSRMVNANSLWTWLYNFCADKAAEEYVPESIKEEEQEKTIELLVRPEEIEKDGSVVIVSIRDGREIGFKYEYDNDFISVMKTNDCKWSTEERIWYLPINERNGSFDDRAADIGSKLLKRGFAVEFTDAGQIAMIESGEWNPKQKRWVGASPDGKYLRITLGERNDSLYESAKSITGAKWEDGYIRILVKHYRQVEDFASSLDFKFDQSAQEAIAKQREKEDAIPVAKVKGKVTKTITVKEALEQKKNKKNDAIIEDLKDD